MYLVPKLRLREMRIVMKYPLVHSFYKIIWQKTFDGISLHFPKWKRRFLVYRIGTRRSLINLESHAVNIPLIFCWWIWHVLKQTSFSWKRKIFPSYQVNAASSRYVRWWNFESVITCSLCKSVNHCKVPPVKLNKAVKRRACARGSIQAGRAPIFLAKFQRKTLETTDVSRNKWNKIETFVEICKRKP